MRNTLVRNSPYLTECQKETADYAFKILNIMNNEEISVAKVRHYFQITSQRAGAIMKTLYENGYVKRRIDNNGKKWYKIKK